MAAPVYTVLFYGVVEFREGDLVTVYEGQVMGLNVVARKVMNESRGSTYIASDRGGGVGWDWPEVVAPIRGYVASGSVKAGVTTFTLSVSAPWANVLEANGSEQKVHGGSLMRNVSGYVDLSEMEAGDVVVLRQYIRVLEALDQVLYAEETYSGVQSPPLIYVTPKKYGYSGEITLQQTAGPHRKFPYQFIEE